MTTMATRLPRKSIETTEALKRGLGRSKYRNVRTTVDGISFASKAEAKRYQELRVLERGKRIRNLELQPRYKLTAHGEPICTYVADFRYIDDNGHIIVEDVKGVETPEFKIKAKLFAAQFGQSIVLI